METIKILVFILAGFMIVSIAPGIKITEFETVEDGPIMWYGHESRLVCIQLSNDGQTAYFTESTLLQENGYPMPSNTFTSLTMLQDGSLILGTITGNRWPFVSKLYHIKNPQCNGSTSYAKLLGTMPDQIGIEALYTDASNRIYAMDTGEQVSSREGNRLLRFIGDVLDGDFQFEAITDLSLSVPDIDGLGPGINKTDGRVVDTPGFAMDTYNVYNVDYVRGTFSYVGSSDGVYAIHAINGSYFSDGKSRLYVISGIPQAGEKFSTLYEINPDTGKTLRTLGSGPSGTGLTGPLPPGPSDFPDLNKPPVANAGLGQVVYESDDVYFNGTGSYDPDGGIITYEWDFDANVDLDGDGNSSNDIEGTGPTPSHIYGDDGVFVATLTVIDNHGLTNTDVCNITVLNLNPTVTIESTTIYVEIDLRVAGSKWSNVAMTLYEDDQAIGYIEVERWPDDPDDNPYFTDPALPTTLDLTKSYKAVVTYDPYPDSGDEINGDQPNNGKDKKDNAANPIWIVLRFEEGSEERIHHTFNTQQSKKRDSDHWDHVEPWVVDIMSCLIGHPFEITAHITDPGSDDETLTYDYSSQSVTVTYPNNPPNPDPYPSPEVHPRDFTDSTILTYEGAAKLILTIEDDDGGTASESLDQA